MSVVRGRACADIMGPRAAGWAKLPMQHQNSLGGASVGRRTSFAQQNSGGAGAKDVVQLAAVSSGSRAGIEGSGGELGDQISLSLMALLRVAYERIRPGRDGVYTIPCRAFALCCMREGPPAEGLRWVHFSSAKKNLRASTAYDPRSRCVASR